MESKFDEKLFVGEEPFTIFRRWLEEARKTEINDPDAIALATVCLLYTSPSPRDLRKSRMPSSA